MSSLLSQSPQKLPVAASHSSLLKETKRNAAIAGGSNGVPPTNQNNHLPNLSPTKTPIKTV
jgi:hypothetical protein